MSLNELPDTFRFPKDPFLIVVFSTLRSLILHTTPRTMTINVTPVNDALIGVSKTVTTLEDKAYVFTTVDFGFADPNDGPANSLLAVKVRTLPLAGIVAIGDIVAARSKFTPVSNKFGSSYASFTFQVQDNGGVANGGIDTDPLSRKITLNVQ